MLNETQFSEEFAKLLIKKFESLQIYSIKGLEVLTKYENSKKHKLLLDNCYSEYLSEPEEIQEIFEKYLQLTDSLYKTKESFNLNGIFPVIKDDRFVEIGIAVNPNFEKNFIYKKYNDKLYIFFVENTETSISYLSQEDFEKLNIDFNELKRISIENLSNSMKIEKYGENGYFMLIADNNYESSLILLDIWNKENFDVKGEIVVGIPASNLLFVTGKNDFENIERLKKKINEINENGEHIVSKELFEYRNGKFETL
jgi:uncharacterized protein YtpQ (UPF0354 family)